MSARFRALLALAPLVLICAASHAQAQSVWTTTANSCIIDNSDLDEYEHGRLQPAAPPARRGIDRRALQRSEPAGFTERIPGMGDAGGRLPRSRRPGRQEPGPRAGHPREQRWQHDQHRRVRQRRIPERPRIPRPSRSRSPTPSTSTTGRTTWSCGSPGKAAAPRTIPRLLCAHAVTLEGAAPREPAPSGPIEWPLPQEGPVHGTDARSGLQVFGDDMQFVEIELDPGEAAIAEAGGMMYMDDGIEMETIFGDGSQQRGGGLLGALLGAGKRLLTGESLFMTVFTNRVSGEAPRRLRRAVSRQDRPDASGRARRRAHRAEGLVPRRRQGRQHRHRVPEAARRGPVRRRRLHHAAAAGRRLGVRPRRRHALRADARAGRGAARGHRLHRRASSRRVDYDIQYRRRRQVGALRRRGPVLRDAARPGPSLAAVAAVQPPGRPHHRGRPEAGRGGREEGSVLGGLGRMLDGDNS